MTSDHLLQAQVVLADGRVVECDEHRYEDLFWALRGAGGGNFGVVTSFAFSTIPAPSATGFHVVWPYSDAVAVIEAWQAWAPVAPDELAASLLLKAADDPDRPPVVNVFGAMLGTGSDTTELLDELVARTGNEPTSAYHTYTPYRETKRYLAELGDQMEGDSQGQPSPPGHSFSKSEFFRQSLPNDVIAALVENLVKGRIHGQSRELDFTPWGGAYNRIHHGATAFVHRADRFLLKHALVVNPDSAAPATQAGLRWLMRSWEAVHQWGSGGVYPNFPDPDLTDWGRAYYGTNLDRLARVKRRYDPDNVFRFHQSLGDGTGSRTRRRRT